MENQENDVDYSSTVRNRRDSVTIYKHARTLNFTARYAREIQGLTARSLPRPRVTILAFHAYVSSLDSAVYAYNRIVSFFIHQLRERSFAKARARARMNESRA